MRVERSFRLCVTTIAAFAVLTYTAAMKPSEANTESEGPDPIPDATKETIATAYHEAGHAVMALAVGRSIQKVTIAPGKLQFGGSRLGTCEIKKGRSKGSKDQLEDDVLVLLAGMVSESRFTGVYCPAGASQDLREVSARLCTRAASQRQHETLLKRMLSKTEHLLNDEANLDAIRAITKELLDKTTISGRAVKHHFEMAQRRHA
ncbi:cell division protein FtsH [Rhodopirellula bahusiensis]|uniref:Cell division protein FtsH n=2 Tax=Rhodopirellula bahusiensis TaxID=2014065 RepID=A0A2G1W4U0_9BACT|nr:cell division protein FtsH [Rhodopirellula bahusiensis]